MKWGVHCKDFLPCYPDRCAYRERRGCAEPAGGGCACVYEVEYYSYYLDGYHRQFEQAVRVLGRDIALEKLRVLAFCELQLHRLRMRINWLDLHLHELRDDHALIERESRLTFKYETTVRNRWLRVLDELAVANRDPREGWSNFDLVQYLLGGVGPACDIATRGFCYDHYCSPQLPQR